ncbi:MAG: hypothetical protein AB1505_08085 [Candidatus Latescibacterota bacterium]
MTRTWTRAALCGVLLVGAASTRSVAEEDGQTLFGEDRKATLRAMRNIAKALGVSCPYCHAKEGGEMLYERDTPQKALARRMYFAFLDTLPTEGEASLTIQRDEGPVRLEAALQGTGSGASIVVTARAAGETFSARLPAPPSGESITCVSCHGQRTRFLTRPE